ncbi:DUF3253 domain-containing protein [Nocardioides sp. 1609]|uniref:DUF3253 domain-containing protein n=1 Tax=Nocardioides sp. 1609 TaxID=2508327 RepID=UPI001FD6EF33|nr:DUF3253 domain-containing protein [Nocardioides sp. 1609]
MDRTDRALEASILALLDARDVGKTICPSEAARAVAADLGRDDWRALMDAARRAAARLLAAGQVVVTQRGEAVDPLTASGPIRIGDAR